MSVAEGLSAPSTAAFSSSWRVYSSSPLKSSSAWRRIVTVISVPKNVVSASTMPSLAPMRAWLLVFSYLASSCASTRLMILGCTLVPVAVVSALASFLDMLITSAVVIVLFAFGLQLLRARMANIQWSPPAGLYCCFRIRLIPYLSRVISA